MKIQENDQLEEPEREFKQKFSDLKNIKVHIVEYQTSSVLKKEESSTKQMQVET